LNSGCNKKRNVQYKVLFMGRHGEGWHNAAESFYGTPAWNVSLVFEGLVPSLEFLDLTQQKPVLLGRAGRKWHRYMGRSATDARR
jgi:hypothetical protein